MVIDVGPNLTLFGFTFLAAKFLLPLIFGIILILAAWLALRYFLNRYGITFNYPLISILAFVLIILLLALS
jgi:hypothetical protein